MSEIKITIEEMKELIQSSAILGALAVDAASGKSSDDISERQAFDEFGRAWIMDRTRRGLIHFNRAGSSNRSPKLYSRFEIKSLKLAEKQLDILTKNKIHELKNK